MQAKFEYESSFKIETGLVLVLEGVGSRQPGLDNHLVLAPGGEGVDPPGLDPVLFLVKRQSPTVGNSTAVDKGSHEI